MLEYLHVKNLALIEECGINFEKGLNILTGETGAGKSILMGSVNLALGERADSGIIRTGADEALVELEFSLDDETGAVLQSMDIPIEDSVFISRKITKTKSIFKINGEIVNARQVKEIAGLLLDIHGQHEHQSLLKNEKQRDMIDAYGGKNIEELLKEVALAEKEYSKAVKDLEDLNARAQGKDREISLLSYECKEIEDAELKTGEDRELEENYKRMLSSEKLLKDINEAINYVSGDSAEDAGALLSRAIGSMSKAASIDPKFEGALGKLEDAEALIGDFCMEASKYADGLEFSEEDFVKTEERLNIINNLKMKFGMSIEDILSSYEEKSSMLKKLMDIDKAVSDATLYMNSCREDYLKRAKKLSDERRKVSYEFSEKLSEELKMLNFTQSLFSVKIESDEDKISSKGFDEIEFMISTNVGEPVRPMKNVASGGELSRIMLAVKTILASKDHVDCLIFDEIDAGISGKTAWEVSKKLKKLSRDHQVISITHLPQIAASADAHFEICKTNDLERTVTSIVRLDSEGEIRELARLLGSDSLSEAALQNARELKKEANA